MARPKQRSGPMAALDIGTSKVVCFIAKSDDEGALRVHGVGHQRARGMRNGQVVDMAQAEQSIRAAVESAEQMANTRIDSVIVAITGGQLIAHNVDASISIAGHPVREADTNRVLEIGRQQHTQFGPARGQELIHCIPTGYAIDGTEGIVDPRGMYGEQLGLRIHMVSTPVGPLRNLTTVIERCHLGIETRVVTPYASALACCRDDEKEMGATVIDLGGGTTTVSVLVGGHPAWVDCVPIGGNHVTNDIAKGLSTPAAYAERLKTVHGSVMPSPADSRELLKVQMVGEEEDTASHEIARSELVRIIRPRMEETLELVRERLSSAGMLHAAGRRLLLTGGGSQLPGIREMAELILDKQVRLARPWRPKGLAESASGPAFAAAVGLLRYAVQDHVAAPQHRADTGNGADGTPLVPDRPTSRLGRLSSWFKENF